MRHALTRTAAGVAAAALATATLAGCSTDDATELLSGQVFVGDVPGTEMFIGFAPESTDDDAPLVAYVCDGDQLAEWFALGDTDDGVSFETDDGARITAEVTEGEVNGTLHFDGQEHGFAAVPATGEAGLYRAETTIDGVEVVGGWIVLADGQRGAVRSTNGAGGTVIGNPTVQPQPTQQQAVIHIELDAEMQQQMQ